MTKENCLFCTPDEELVVYKNECGLIVANLLQVAKIPFAIMILPTKHVIKFEDIPDSDYMSFVELLISAKKKLVQKLFEFEIIGFDILINEGRGAGQTIDHLHAHIFPRTKDDQITDMWEPKHSRDCEAVIIGNKHTDGLVYPTNLVRIPYGIKVVPHQRTSRLEELIEYHSFFELLKEAKLKVSEMNPEKTGTNILISERGDKQLYAWIEPRDEYDGIKNMARPTRRKITSEELEKIQLLFK